MNIAEILSDAPKGTRLYSPLFGDVEFLEITPNEEFCILVKDIENEYVASFNPDGKYLKSSPNTEVMLFPSKENRDWSTYKANPKFPISIEKSLNFLGYTEDDIWNHNFDILSYLHDLLVCRDAWWKADNDWKPNWTDNREAKYTITFVQNDVYKDIVYGSNYILAFRTRIIRDEFYRIFKDLIEKCKKLL